MTFKCLIFRYLNVIYLVKLLIIHFQLLINKLPLLKNLITISLIFISFFTSAHVGSPGVVFEGQAGKYNLQVYVQPPDVIPGTAQVTVFTDGNDIDKIRIKPVYFWFGDEGSPVSDEIFAVAGQTGKFDGMVWFMSPLAGSVEVEVMGKRGIAKMIVPVAAVSTAKRSMPAGLGWILAALGIFLVGVLTTIFGASVSDSLQPAGEKATSKTIRKRVTGSLVGASFCGLLLFIGNNWWGGLAKEHLKEMYKPYRASTKVVNENGQDLLKLTIDSNSVYNRKLSYVIPDHGKLMHLFLVRQGTMDAFAHLHPVRKDTLNFEALLPNLPAGKYLVYADIMRYVGGFQYTLTDTVEIKNAVRNTKVQDPDDTYAITNALNEKSLNSLDETITICGTPGVKTKLQDGSSIVWEADSKKSMMAGQIYDLKFSVVSPDGKEAVLQPYLGMMGHVAVVKTDGSVYIHLHPTGTVSSTSVDVMQKRVEETSVEPFIATPLVFKDSIDKVLAKIQTMPEAQRDQFLMPNMNHNTKEHHGGSVKFPYVFPTAGSYRIWLQIKRDGKILTGVFDAVVI